MELKAIYSNFIKYAFLLGVLVLLCGCPRIAWVDVYNNTNVSIQLNSAGIEKSISPGGHVRVRFPWDFFNITSDLGDWKYGRNIPHSGRDGEFFDGTLYVQIEGDGKAYAIRKEDKSPVKILNYEQPVGYPLSPMNRVETVKKGTVINK